MGDVFFKCAGRNNGVCSLNILHREAALLQSFTYRAHLAEHMQRRLPSVVMKS